MYSYEKILRESGVRVTEGNTGMNPGSVSLLQKLASPSGITRVMEIGFNGGHSAYTLLSSNPNITLTSFDIGRHGYESGAKKCIDNLFPGRHTLVLGDSRKTVPLHDPDHKYDLIFVDGGHKGDIPDTDLKNCKRLAHPETVVLMDDIVCKENWKKPYTEGPSRAWNSMVTSGEIVQDGHVDFRKGYGMSWGRFINPDQGTSVPPEETKSFYTLSPPGEGR